MHAKENSEILFPLDKAMRPRDISAQSKLFISKDGTDFLVMYIDNRTYSQPIKIIHLTQV